MGGCGLPKILCAPPAASDGIGEARGQRRPSGSVGRRSATRPGGCRTPSSIGHLDRLWAPWRAQYILESSGQPEPDGGCFLCRGLAARDDRENLLAWRGEHAAVFLNKFPYNNGHLLVAPNVHKGRLDELEGPELTGPVEALRGSSACSTG